LLEVSQLEQIRITEGGKQRLRESA
jgi:hypothetical protein